MVILEYTETNHDFVAYTPLGLVPALLFQNRYFVIQKTFQRLQEAVKDCREQVEKGFVSLVVQFSDHVEIWSQVADHVRVQSGVRPTPEAQSRFVSFRGQTTVLSGTARKQSPTISFRGQQSSWSSGSLDPVRLPESFFYRGHIVPGDSARS